MAYVLESPSRIHALQKTQLLDSAADPAFDRITRLVRHFMGVDVCLISLVAKDRQFFKSSIGLPSPWAEKRETPLSHSFCQHVVTRNATVVVSDANADPVLSSNAAVADMNVIAYLGVPIRSGTGEVLGSLCAINSKPTKWTAQDKSILEDFAGIVEDEIALKLLATLADAIALENEILAREYHHRVKNSLSVASALISLSARENLSAAELVSATQGRLMSLAKAHDALIEQSDDVNMEHLLVRLIEPYQTVENRFTAMGALVALRYKQVTPLCLIVHELATNSAKYGAVRLGNGLTLKWTVDDDVVSLFWREDAGLLESVKAEKAGFGSTLLKVAATQLSGSVITTWSGPLLEIKISFPLGA